MKDKTGVFNVLGDDFTVTYDINENGKPLNFTVKAGEISYFDAVIATHIKKHLATAVLNERDNIKTNWQDAYNEVLKEISVEF